MVQLVGMGANASRTRSFGITGKEVSRKAAAPWARERRTISHNKIRTTMDGLGQTKLTNFLRRHYRVELLSCGDKKSPKSYAPDGKPMEY